MKPKFQYIAILLFFHIVLFNVSFLYAEQKESLIKEKDNVERLGIAFKVFFEINDEPDVNTVWATKYNGKWAVTDL